MKGKIARILLTLGVGATGMAVARLLRIPGGAFMGAFFVTALANLLKAPLGGPPKLLRTAGRSVLGLTIGATVTNETLQAIARALLPVSIMIVMLLALGLVAALLLQRWTHMPRATALCGTAPGALAAMVSLADDLGGDGAVVASMHLVRVVSILALVPPFVTTLFKPSLEPSLALAAAVAPDGMLWRLALLLAIALVAGFAAERAKLPAGEMLAGMAIAAILNPAWLHLGDLPAAMKLFPQWVVGSSMGATVTLSTLRHFKPYALAGGVTTAALIILGLGMGWVLAQLTSLDLVTCIVGSSPGGADTMVILASELGADTQLVAAMHVSRMVLIMLFLPLLTRTALGRSVTKPHTVSAGAHK
jgi:membrane AbrB-like protein